MQSPFFSLFEVLYIIGILLSVFCFVFLYRSDRNKNSSRILAWCLLMNGIVLTRFLCHTQNWWSNPYITYFPFSIELFPAPLFYLYTLSLESKTDERPNNFWLFLLPGLLFLFHGTITYITCLFYRNVDQKMHVSENVFHYNAVNRVEDFLAVFFFIIFGYLSVSKLIKYRRKLIAYYADKYAHQISWLLWLAIYFAIGIIITTILILSNELFNYNANNFWHEKLYNACLAIFAAMCTYFVIREMHLIPLHIFKEDVVSKENTTKDLTLQFKKLESYLKSSESFRNPNLSLPILAEELEMKSYILSQSIKQVKGSSFREYVNKYRVEDVIKKLDDPNFQHLTILGLGFDAGFNSEASFYRVFKNETNKSPKEYKKGLSNS